MRVVDVAGRPPRDLLLVLEHEQREGILRLCLSASPDGPRLHLQQGRLHAHKGSLAPFFARAASELAGARLVSIEQVRGDRLVIVEFRETPSGERRALLAEFTGRAANLILLGQGDRILEVLAPPPKKQAARLALGQEWTPPGGHAGAAPGGPGPSVEEAFPAPEEPPPGPAERASRAPLSWRVECALGGLAQDAQRGDERKKLLSRVSRKLGRAQNLVQGLERKLDASARAERVRQDGELLKAALGRFARGDERIALEDWFEEGTPERVIELDPARAPRDNVTRLFERAKKLERARESVASELSLAREKLARLEALAEAAAVEDTDPRTLDDEAVAAGLLDKRQEGDVRKRKAPEPRKPYRSFSACHGTEVLVGRTAKDNDTVTFRLARGNDLWLHTADTPGSHVILRLARGAEPDAEEVLDAAHLAVHFSPQRGTDRASVHVALRKLVHKPKGAPAGLVTVSGGRMMKVRMEPERLQRLLGRGRGG